MKCLLKFFTCFGSALQPSPMPPHPSPDSRPPLGGNRGRAVSALRKSRSVAEWRPSLCSISENHLPPENKCRASADPATAMKKKSRSVTVHGSRSPNYNYDSEYENQSWFSIFFLISSWFQRLGRRSVMPVVVAPFAPLPFMF
ncbi:hypothetical protein NMG60_11002275 [Bertholletia excelsa]